MTQKLGSGSAQMRPQDIQAALDLGAINVPQLRLGYQVIRGSSRIIKGRYDFSIQGGAISTILLFDPTHSHGLFPIVLPPSAIVTRALIDVITPCTTSASGTVAISSGQAAADLMAATAAASVTGLLDGIPVNTAATSIKVTSTTAQPGVTPYIVIATGALTAGKFNVHIEYYLSD